MAMISKGFVLRLATVAMALVVGPATLAPGTAEAPSRSTSARAGDGATAAQKFKWGPALWDFAWEFGESLDDGPYKGSGGNGWAEYTDGSGRVVKYGGGIEFQSGDKGRGKFGPDNGNLMLIQQGLAAQRGRWEIKEKIDEMKQGEGRYRFIIELIPEDPKISPCERSITIAEVKVADDYLKIGATGGTTKWGKTFADGYLQNNSTYNFAVEITRKRVTWFANGRAIASTGAAGARPTVPMVLRLRMVSVKGEMNKTTAKVDWIRSYDLSRGTVPPNGAGLKSSTNRC